MERMYEVYGFVPPRVACGKIRFQLLSPAEAGHQSICFVPPQILCLLTN